MLLLRCALFLLVGLALGGCRRQPSPRETGARHLAALREAGLLAGSRGATQVLAVRMVSPRPTRWSADPAPFWWASLRNEDGEAGYLAWKADASQELLDFSLEGLVALETPAARVLDGVPPVQQFVVRGGDGQPVASGCVPTAGASLIAYWSNRGTFDWQADDSHQGLTRRLRDRMPMVVLPDLEGYTDGAMALAGASTEALVAALAEDAKDYKVRVTIARTPFDFGALQREIGLGQPVVLICGVLVPRKPELAWGHAVVAVGFAQVAGRPFVAVVDNFHVPRQPGTVRWIAAERCRELVFVRPVR